MRSAHLARVAPSGAGVGLLVLVAVGGMALAGGASEPAVWGLVSLGLLSVLAAGLLLGARIQVDPLSIIALSCLAGLLAWAAVSALWSLDRAEAVLEVQRGLVAITGLALVLLFVRRTAVSAVLVGLAAACTLASIVALLGWLSGDAAVGGGFAEPIGYPNALGLLAAMGVVLSLGLATRHTARKRGRLLGGGGAGLLGATLCLTNSAGGFVALAVGLGVSLSLAGARRSALARCLARAAAVAAALVVAATVVASAGGATDGPTSSTTAFAGAGGAPSVAVEPRLRFWAVAWHSAGDAPLLGAGAGAFERAWFEQRSVPVPASNAHNLYLETLAELGVVGLALLLTALAAPLLAAARARSHPLAPAAAGAYAAFLAHAAFDVSWEVPVLALAALLCGGAVVVMGRRHPTDRRLPPAACAGAVAAVLALGVFACAGVIGNATLERSRDLARIGAVEAAKVEAEAAVRWVPWSAEPWRVLGEAALARGNRALARTRFVNGLERDPRSWLLWTDLARASRGSARQEAAQRAALLNPLGSH